MIFYVLFSFVSQRTFFLIFMNENNTNRYRHDFSLSNNNHHNSLVKSENQVNNLKLTFGRTYSKEEGKVGFVLLLRIPSVEWNIFQNEIWRRNWLNIVCLWINCCLFRRLSVVNKILCSNRCRKNWLVLYFCSVGQYT